MVSRQTQGFVECIISLNKHRDMVYEALAVMFHKETAYKELSNRYDPAFREMNTILREFMADSIENNVIEINSNEI
jgi:hypothetical protein